MDEIQWPSGVWNGWAQEQNQTKRWENLSGEDRKVDGNELVSYHLHLLPYKIGRQREKKYKESERVDRTGQGMICLVGTGESRLWRNEP